MLVINLAINNEEKIMKKLATTLTALVIATGLTVSAQAATKVTTTTKSTTTHKNVASAKAKPQKATQKSTKASKNTHSTKASAKAKKGSRATPRTSEINIDIPADLKIDESTNKSVAPSAPMNAQPNPAVVVPVVKVIPKGPAVQAVTVKPIDDNTAIASTTTIVPVDVQTVPVLDRDDQIDLIYKIEEQRTAQVSAGISYSPAEHFGFNVGADLKNFVGTGKDVNFVFNYGKAIQTYMLGYNDPYFTDSGVGMGFNLYNTQSNLSRTSSVFDYRVDVTGFNVAWLFRVSQYSSIRAGLGADHSVLKMNYATAPTQAQAFVRAYNSGQPYANTDMTLGFKEYYGTFAWIHNNLDNYLFPTRGISTAIEMKCDIPSSQLKLYKIDYDFGWFKTIYDPLVFNFGLTLGYQNVYDGKPFPFFKHYYLGGADSVRGFEERSLGPRSSLGQPFGGNIVGDGRVQFIFPPPFVPDTKTVRMALFLDAGQVYDTHNKANAQEEAANPTGIRYSSGVAVVWNTPLGMPITISVAWPLNKKAGDDLKVFAFSLGTQF